MTTVSQWLAEHGELERLDAELLLAEALHVSRAQIIAYPERALSQTEARDLSLLARRLTSGEPLAYLTGAREFWGLTFGVSPDVLVPRPETELLVETAAARAPANARVLDLGTGSGAIAVALACERPDLELTATDNSPAALALARRNAAHHGASIGFVLSDWYRALSGRWDAIVCNPPYVRPDDEHLAALHAEPRGALVADSEGLGALARVIAGASEHLTGRGLLLLEHGYDQAHDVRDLLRRAGFTDLETLPDLNRIERVTLGYLTA